MTEYFWMFYIIKNHLGSHLFERLFKNNKIEKIFKFLDNESSLIDDLKITLSFPKISFH